MKLSNIASAGAICAAAHYTPLVAVLLVVFLVVSTASFLHWFAEQPKSARADVIRLIRALRGD